MDNKGVIYILTNPSFPEYVKIGYADNIKTDYDSLTGGSAALDVNQTNNENLSIFPYFLIIALKAPMGGK